MIFNLNFENISLNVLSSGLILKKFFAAGFIKMISPCILKATIPSVMCNNIVSIWFFLVDTSLSLSFNSVFSSAFINLFLGQITYLVKNLDINIADMETTEIHIIIAIFVCLWIISILFIISLSEICFFNSPNRNV